ncbi:MOSC domain-containing protein [uncultured Shewanella sp.]|uniref:MOSC domain-containing protein n=1 Tax=uncultured Shewanella sp. TaxID=173975 RepID=UPI00261AB80F|nr:MOSC domain-containing protein [uncultured Shewanella sp.]
MKIISTNISKIKTVLYNGKEVTTGIFKRPTNDEVSIEKLSIIGDQQADLVYHGGEHKAVYAFSSHHYDYWKTILNNSQLSNGSFGENFTVSNLFEENICIGDQFRIGSALLEVSQPRVPCYKLGIALDNKDAVKLFTKNYCTGVYFRVLESGTAKTGHSVHIEKKLAHGVSIKNLFRAYFDRHYVGVEDLFAQALALPELAPEWKKKLEKRMSLKSE